MVRAGEAQHANPNTYRRILAYAMYEDEIERLVGAYNQAGEHGDVYSPHLVSAQQCMWLCALAFWQLLPMRDVVQEDYQAWYPRGKHQCAKLTPYQVQRSALAFLLELVPPASQPKPTEKAKAGK